MERPHRPEWTGQIRVGKVSAVNAANHTCEVKFEDVAEDVTTWHLHVVVRSPGDFALYEEDTQVLCVILDGRLGRGYVLGVVYQDGDAPLDDSGKRSIAGDDIRLGDPEASDKVALAPKCKGNFDDQKSHFDAVWNVITGSVINEPGLGNPSALQAALKLAIQASPYPTPEDPAAENVSAK